MDLLSHLCVLVLRRELTAYLGAAGVADLIDPLCDRADEKAQG
jgi:hypothetical protein|tara:strand:- start:217 stop:345 length:129 start_codon:yes stop_codon:yes gene_type:complete